MLKARVTKGFPLWDAENKVYITSTEVEVQDSSWLQSQIAAGLVEVTSTTTEKAKPAAKGTTTKAS